MFLCKIAVFALAASTLAFGAGCAAAGGEDSTQAEAAQGEDLKLPTPIANPDDEGTFQLYGTPHASPGAPCDVFTSLELTHEGARADLVADLHEAVTGVCKIAVPADARAYRLVLDSVECGSKTYTGTSPDGAHTVTLTDHRARYCRDAVPAEIVAVEHVPGAAARTLYSLDQESPQP